MNIDPNLRLTDVRDIKDSAWFYSLDISALSQQGIETVAQLADASQDTIDIACRDGFSDLANRIHSLIEHVPEEFVLEDVRPGMFDGSIALAPDGRIVATLPDPSL